jgi:23S rRNA (uracil1939-C5)-methyltransferase
VENLLNRAIEENRLPPDSVSALRYLLIRSSKTHDNVLIVCVARKDISDEMRSVLAPLCGSRHVAGILLNINDQPGNSVLGSETRHLSGEPVIRETIDGLSFDISAKSFFQINVSAARGLFACAIELAELKPHETVVDVFSGTGVVTLMAAKHCLQATGVEVADEAVSDARRTARLNSIENATFIAGDAALCLQSIGETDVVFLDPPRKGCDVRVIEETTRLLPSRVIYISCSPKTFARDAAEFANRGFELQLVQPVDLFPQTAHIEVIGVFRKQQ